MGSAKGVDDIVSILKNFKQQMKKSESIPDGEVSLGSVKDQMTARGSIKSRLSKNDKEAEIIAGVEAIRDQEPTIESGTDDELNEKDNQIVMKMVDDMIEKTILGE